MYETRKMLLATSDALSSHHGELRAALVSAALELQAFEIVSVKRAPLLFGAAPIKFSHIEVRGHALSAWRDGVRQSIRVHADADALDPLWKAVPGTAAETVVEMARTTGADLTVFAPHHQNALAKMLVPSGSRDIVRHSRNNLLVVHKEPRDVYRKVLVAVDFSAECYAAARVALALAPSAHFTFVHAYRLPDLELMRELELSPAVIGSYLAQGCESAWEALNAWIDDLGPFTQPWVGAVHSGLPVPVISASARQLDADLIVVGRQGRTRKSHFGLGDVARRLSTQAPCDVLVGASLAGASSASAAVRRLSRESRSQDTDTLATIIKGTV